MHQTTLDLHLYRKSSLQVLSQTEGGWSGVINFVRLSTLSGDIGILPNHGHFTSVLDIGVIEIQQNEKIRYIYIDGGCVTIQTTNKIVIVTEQAKKAGLINKDKVVAKLMKREEKLRLCNPRNMRNILRGLKKAKVQLEAQALFDKGS